MTMIIQKIKSKFKNVKALVVPVDFTDYKAEDLPKGADGSRQDLQDAAKQIWIYQTTVKIHYLYIEAFDLLKTKEHYKGWCKLEEI